MVKHFIVIGSSYSLGKRIALDYCDEKEVKLATFEKRLKNLAEIFGPDIPVSTHFLQTESKDWASVGKMDMFFKDVELIKDEKTFINIILEDRYLTGLDVAKYILTQIRCTHLKLEKLVYMCYADYLCETNERLFVDQIYAYKFGLVIKSVYETYKRTKQIKEDNKTKYDEERRRLAVRSRIISSEKGLEKLAFINKTIEKYKDYTASELVDLTHQEFSPWQKNGKENELNKLIKDQDIIKYHRYETI